MKNVGLHLLRAAPLIAALATWQCFCEGNARREFLFSTPTRVMTRLAIDLREGSLARDALVTASEAGVGFALATCSGTCLGLALASTSVLRRIVGPYLSLLGAVPIYALAPMTILWFGIGFGQKVGIAFLSTVFVASNQAFYGAANPPVEQLLVLRAFRATPLQVLRHLRLPVAVSWVAAGCRLNIGFALLGAFLGEVISSNAGLGHFIMRCSSLYDVPGVLAGIATLLGVAWVMDRVVLAVFQRWFLPAPAALIKV